MEMEAKIAAMEATQQAMGADVREIKGTMKGIAISLRQLAVLAAKHEAVAEALMRAFTRLDDHDARIRAIEDALPSIKMASGWVFKAALGIIGLLAAAAFKMAFFG